MSEKSEPKPPNFQWYEYLGFAIFCVILLFSGQCTRSEIPTQSTYMEVAPE